MLRLEEGFGGVKTPTCEAPVDNGNATYYNGEDFDHGVGDDNGEEKVRYLMIPETRVAARQMRKRKNATFTMFMVMMRLIRTSRVHFAKILFG